jgi:hypothetical protein
MIVMAQQNYFDGYSIKIETPYPEMSNPIKQEIKPSIESYESVTVMKFRGKSKIKKLVSPLGQMGIATVTFGIPIEANIDDTIPAEVIITPKDIKQSVKNSVLPLELQEVIKTTEIMTVRLKSADFEITNITPEKQLLLKDESTVWQWRLQPLEPGVGIVTLSINALIQGNNNHEIQRHIKTLEKSIKVNITEKQKVANFIENNWQWLWSVILIPFITTFYTFLLSFFKKKED